MYCLSHKASGLCRGDAFGRYEFRKRKVIYVRTFTQFIYVNVGLRNFLNDKASRATKKRICCRPSFLVEACWLERFAFSELRVWG
jgi:hypothetical protein